MSGAVYIHELKELLHKIAVADKGVSIRLHLIDRPAPQYFAEVLVYAKHALLLVHMPTRTVLNVPDLSQVTSFTLNKAFEVFSGGQEYKVIQSHPLKRSEHGPFHEEHTF
jgi:hypothetical protein